MTNPSARRCRLDDRDHRHGIETPTDASPAVGNHSLEGVEMDDGHRTEAAAAKAGSTDRAADHQRGTPISRSLSRRGFIAGSAGIAATAVAPGIAAGQTDSDDRGEAVLTGAAISTTVPTLDGDDYTGLFLQVVKVEATEEIDVGVRSCDVLPSDAEIIAYETRLIDRIEGDRQSTSAILYAEEGNEEIHEGKLFVIDSQESCPENFVGLRLERVGAELIETDEGETDSAAPGFGVGTAVAGLGTASLVALRRRLQTE